MQSSVKVSNTAKVVDSMSMDKIPYQDTHTHKTKYLLGKTKTYLKKEDTYILHLATLMEGLNGHEGDGERGRNHCKGKESGEDKTHMAFLSKFLPNMKSCAANKEEADNKE